MKNGLPNPRPPPVDEPDRPKGQYVVFVDWIKYINEVDPYVSEIEEIMNDTDR